MNSCFKKLAVEKLGYFIEANGFTTIFVMCPVAKNEITIAVLKARSVCV